jgi:type II secretory ATPase GspE/PulE/Tfp pilus assembly ATPase PilB-like protein
VINELFLPNEEVGEVVRSGADLTELRRLAGTMGFIDMTDDGKEKVRRGLTTKDEVDRVNRSHRLSEEEREGV